MSLSGRIPVSMKPLPVVMSQAAEAFNTNGYCAASQSPTIRCFGHHACDAPHQGTDRRRHGCCTGRVGLASVALLVALHLLDDPARALIGLRQALQVRAQVLGDLPLGLRDETEAVAIARKPGHRANDEGSSVPERAQ